MSANIVVHKELTPAIDEWNAARAAYEKMESIGLGDFAAYEYAWRDFLRRIDRVWKKMKSVCTGKPGWQTPASKIGHLRKTDSLLKYLIHARNVDEHTISDVVTEWNPNMQAKQFGTSVLLEWKEWDRPLLAVTDRGVCYSPPNQHLGQPLKTYRKKGEAESVLVARLALDFYFRQLSIVSMSVYQHDESVPDLAASH